MEECIHGLGDPAWCVLCNGRAARDRRVLAATAAQRRRAAAWFASQRRTEVPLQDMPRSAGHHPGAYVESRVLIENDNDRYRGPSQRRSTAFALAKIKS